MSEKKIEKLLCTKVKKHGGITYKLLGLVNGLPDRIVILPGGDVWFVELKTKTNRCSRIQEYRIKELQEHGANVRVIHGCEEVVNFVKEVLSDGIQAP